MNRQRDAVASRIKGLRIAKATNTEKNDAVRRVSQTYVGELRGRQHTPIARSSRPLNSAGTNRALPIRLCTGYYAH